MSNFVVYTKDGCSYCVAAKNLLNGKGYVYEELKIGRDISRDAFMASFPHVRTLPYVLADDTPIGGYNELNEWVKMNGPQYLAEAS